MHTENLFCHGIKDIVTYFEDHDLIQLKAYFGHSATILLMLRALNAAKDLEHLRADNFNRMNHRKYYTSVLSPFAANIAAIKYKCETNDSTNTVNKIRFLLNEKPLKLNWCSDADGLCKLDDMKEIYNRFYVGDCNTLYCSIENNAKDALTFTLIGLLVIILLVACCGIVMQYYL